MKMDEKEGVLDQGGRGYGEVGEKTGRGARGSKEEEIGREGLKRERRRENEHGP